MKNKLLLMTVCIMFMCPIVIAEENSYFPKGMKWTSLYMEQDGRLCGGKPVCTIMGDTVIEGRKYQTLVYTNFDELYVAPIREYDNKIFVYITDRDVLLYDFGIEIGDSIPNNYIYPFFGENGIPMIEVNGYAHVIKTDSILLLSGQKAKRLFFDNNREDIEYIGSAKGILSYWGYPPTPTCYGVKYNFCCSLNGEPIYEYNLGDCERINTLLPINNVQADLSSATKLLRNGQILILRGDKTYTVTGQEVKQ